MNTKGSMKILKGVEEIEELGADLLQDESNLSGAWCSMAAWPEKAEDVKEFVNICLDEGMKLTVSGATTGIAGGALPEGGAVLSTTQLKGIRMLNGPCLRAGAGVTVQEIDDFLESAGRGLFYPPDPTEDTASLGGTVATDASGSDSYLYGSTRRWIRSLQLVTPEGDLLRINRGEHTFRELVCTHPVLGRIELPELSRPQPGKNAAGYFMHPGMDLIDLLIGSEGTLGIVTEADLILAREPEFLMELAVFPESEESFWKLYRSLLSPPSPVKVRTLEMMDGRCIDFLRHHPGELPPPPEEAEYVLLIKTEAESEDELDETLMALDEMITAAGVDPDSAWGGFEPSEIEKIKDFRHALPESVNRRISDIRREQPSIHKFGSDGAVAPERLRTYYNRVRDILEKKNLPHVIFGHAGQGHLHANAIPENEEEMELAEEAMYEIAAAAVEMGGTVSAEHGLGRLKLKYLELMYTEDEIRGMRRIRSTMDPDSLLAPEIRF
ncbi:MAG: FAD-binding protein [Candidatus Aegiribacteria sp.]|nr:FAD-binding protein [Candidatus Aegiribacteria sp.]MBD3294065.1 FAD-binding protein [Candidatus Fermentibacteria bacterium]